MSKRSRKKRNIKRKTRKTRKTRTRIRKKRRKSKNVSSKQIFKQDSEGSTVIKVSDTWSNQALVNKAKYQKKYNLSIKENEKFWKKEGKRITWIKPYT